MPRLSRPAMWLLVVVAVAFAPAVAATPPAEDPKVPMSPKVTHDTESGALPLEARGDLPLEGPAPDSPAPERKGWQHELSGHFGFAIGFFFADPVSAAQPELYSTSFVFEPGYSLKLGDHVTLRAVGLARLDQHDPQRTRLDARQALAQLVLGRWTLQLGIHKVFWGVTESRHLVDIINQTDYAAAIDGEDKLGQLMALCSFSAGVFGTFELLVATWFRPQPFPGTSGRPGAPLAVLDAAPEYASELGQWQPDVAFRWAGNAHALNWAVSYFYGTSREPELRLVPISSGVALGQRYSVIHQVGAELQWTVGSWLWKAEVLVRSGQGPLFAATTGGFEHTFSRVFGTDADLRLLLEYNYDGRDNATFNIFDHDAFGAVRLSLNDEHSTELLVGALVDVTTGTTFGSLEASRRFGSSWVVTLEGRLIVASDKDDPLYWFRKDSHLRLRLEIYY